MDYSPVTKEFLFGKLREKIDVREFIRLKGSIINSNKDLQTQIDTINAKIYQI